MTMRNHEVVARGDQHPNATALSSLTEGDSQTLYSVGDLLNKLSTMKEIAQDDRNEFERKVTQLKYETRYKRLYLQERMYRLAMDALRQLEYVMQSGGGGRDLAVSAAQFRLLVKDYMNQTREEYGEARGAPLIDARRQTINVIKIVEVDPSDNGRIIDVEDFDVT